LVRPRRCHSPFIRTCCALPALQAGQRRPRHAGAAALSRSQEYPAYGPIPELSPCSVLIVVLGIAGPLPPRRKRPRGYRAAEKRDELAPSHSITSSAAACSVRGTVRPSACAVLRLITNSNWVGCRTGSCAGLVPLRICATYSPAWRYIQLMLGP
jgi:hypothetical protein